MTIYYFYTVPRSRRDRSQQWQLRSTPRNRSQLSSRLKGGARPRPGSPGRRSSGSGSRGGELRCPARVGTSAPSRPHLTPPSRWRFPTPRGADWAIHRRRTSAVLQGWGIVLVGAAPSLRWRPAADTAPPDAASPVVASCGRGSRSASSSGHLPLPFAGYGRS